MTFENARVGDKVESLRYGAGKIVKIEKDIDLRRYPVGVSFANLPHIERYTVNGFSNVAETRPDLYWPGVQVIPAPPPKRTVKKTVNGFVVYYVDNGSAHSICGTREQAELLVHYSALRLGISETSYTVEVSDE